MMDKLCHGSSIKGQEIRMGKIISSKNLQMSLDKNLWDFAHKGNKDTILFLGSK